MTEALPAAVAAIRNGLLVALPTETVYGLAADALDPQAVLRIFTAKGRPRFDPLIVHVPDAAAAWQVAVPSPRAERLAAACWPGPLTLVLPRRACVPDLVTSGLPTVGVRVPDHPLALALLRSCGRPLAAPSANPFGRVSPTTADHVREQLGAAVAVVLDGGPCRVGVESTVLRPDPVPLILRPGGLTRERLEALLGEPVALAGAGERADSLPREAPGLLASHYAPKIPLSLKGPADPWPQRPGAVRLAFRAGGDAVLSSAGDLAEAAAGLFAVLRRLEGSGAQEIIAETVPEQGLGLAINDRLRRAAGLGAT